VTRGLTIHEIEAAIELRRTTEMSWRQIGVVIAKRSGRAVAYQRDAMQRACKPFMEDAESAASQQEK